MNMDNGNKNEFMLWIAILAIIGVFIFFMPDIEKFLFRRAEKKDFDTEEIREAKRKETNRTNNEAQKESSEKKKTVDSSKTSSTTGTTYTCTLNKKESSYTQDDTIKYVFDKEGKTLTMDKNVTVKFDTEDGYNQIKPRYEESKIVAKDIDKSFDKYYTNIVTSDDSAKTIKISIKVTNYTKAMEILNSYNKSHKDAEVDIGVYPTYNQAEINMKSDGYNCKLS